MLVIWLADGKSATWSQLVRYWLFIVWRYYLVQIQSHVRVLSVYIDIRKFPVSVNGFYPLRSTSNSASFPSFLTASYSCVILPFFLCSNQLFFHSRYSQATTSTCDRWCVTTNLNCNNSYTNLFGLTTSPCEIQSLIAPLSCQRDLLVCFVFTWFVGGNPAKKSCKETWEMKCTCTSWKRSVAHSPLEIKFENQPLLEQERNLYN